MRLSACSLDAGRLDADHLIAAKHHDGLAHQGERGGPDRFVDRRLKLSPFGHPAAALCPAADVAKMRRRGGPPGWPPRALSTAWPQAWRPLQRPWLAHPAARC